MSEAGYASLSPKLLANKGGAKPAMRSQMAVGPAAMFTNDSLEDLGWNDMGEAEEGTPVMGEVIPMNNHRGTSEPGVVQQPHTVSPVSKPTPTKTAQLDSGRRTAFTLRLDQTRHLKLRLAATMLDMSAQAIVSDALDAALAELPELDRLAASMKRT